MAEQATLDNCGNCRYWDRKDGSLDAEELSSGLGVCRIQSYPEDFDNHLGYVSIDEESAVEAAVLVTDPEFFCNLYKVRH